MLKHTIILLSLITLSIPAFARTNSQIGAQLYAVSREVDKQSKAKGDMMRDNIASFLIDANMLNFYENNAVWKKLPSGWLYDSKTVQHLYLRHLGVYKSPDGKVMGVFDVNCEDVNDVQERTYGYVKTTEVYFSPYYRQKRGRSLGFIQTFCK